MKKLFATAISALCLAMSAYAVDYAPVTDVADLKAGDKVIIAAKDYPVAISTTQNPNNRAQATVELKDGLIVNPADDVQIITLEGDATGWYFSVGNGFLKAASSGKNNLHTGEADDNAKALITIADDGTASIVFQGSFTRNMMQYNYSSSLFSCYGSASQKPLALYKEAAVAEGETPAPRIVVDTTADNTVALVCDDAAAAIYYTLDGTEPDDNATLYTAPFQFSGITTVKAVALANGKYSSVATATVRPNAVATIAEYLEINSSSNVKITSPVTVAYQSADTKYTYVFDATGALQIYASNGNMTTYTQGAVIPAGFKGSCSTYVGVQQMVPEVETFAEATATAEVTPIEVTIPELDADFSKYLCHYIVLKDVSYNSKEIVKGENRMTVYNRFGLTFEDNASCDVYGIANLYNKTKQVYPINVVPCETQLEQVATPQFSIAAGEVEKGTTVAITCATPGSEIWYWINGGVETLYTEPIVVDADMTIYAYAACVGMLPSAHISARYTVKAEELPLPQGPATATFDFTDPAGLNPAQPTEAATESNGTPVNDVVFRADHATFVAARAEASNDCRLWYTASATQLRAYNKATITIAVADGCYINSLSFNGSNLQNLGVEGKSLQNYTQEVYGPVSTLTFTLVGTVNINNVTVNYSTAYTDEPEPPVRDVLSVVGDFQGWDVSAPATFVCDDNGIYSFTFPENTSEFKMSTTAEGSSWINFNQGALMVANSEPIADNTGATKYDLVNGDGNNNFDYTEGQWTVYVDLANKQLWAVNATDKPGTEPEQPIDLPVDKTATFDWTNPEALDPAMPAPYESDDAATKSVYIGGMTFVSGNVQCTFDDSEVGADTRLARLWYTKNGIELRTYSGTNTTLAAPTNYAIVKVEFIGAKAAGFSCADGILTDNVWQATKEQSTVTFHNESNTQVTAINVYLAQLAPDAEVVPGDANGNGYITVADVTTIINHILGRHNDEFSATGADVNGDGEINITDALLTINIILGK